MADILYSDAQIVVCVKPVGVSSEEPTWLGEDVFPVHRLDQAVGGVMVYARTKQAAAALSASMQAGSFQKEYLAVLCGVPAQAEGDLEDLLYFDRSRNKSFVVRKQRAGVKAARLSYSVLSRAPDEGRDRALVSVTLHTGRTHQIRVQFASRALPLLGDGKYGGSDNRCSAALWSHRLCFPLNGKTLTFSAEPPAVFPWTLFGEIS